MTRQQTEISKQHICTTNRVWTMFGRNKVNRKLRELFISIIGSQTHALTDMNKTACQLFGVSILCINNVYNIFMGKYMEGK